MYICLHVKYQLFLSDFDETQIFSTGFWKKYSNKKFHENPSSGSRVVPFGRTYRHDKSNNSRFSQYFANAPKSDLLGIIWEVCKWIGLAQDWCIEARFDTNTVQFRICTNRGIVSHTLESFRINEMYVHKHRNITKCFLYFFFITDFLINNSAQL